MGFIAAEVESLRDYWGPLLTHCPRKLESTIVVFIFKDGDQPDTIVKSLEEILSDIALASCPISVVGEAISLAKQAHHNKYFPCIYNPYPGKYIAAIVKED